jgi:hypothetical protein
MTDDERPEFRIMRQLGLDLEPEPDELPERELLRRHADEDFLNGNGHLPPEPPLEDDPPYDDAPESPPPADQDQTEIDRRYLDLVGRVLDIDGLRNITPPTPLVDDYLFQDSLAWLGGKPGHAKTFVAVDVACCVGTGTPWHGSSVVEGRVLYLIAEGASGIALRVNAWELAHGRKADNVLFLPVPVQMMEPIDVAAFGLVLAALQPILVVLDTQARVTVGADENSSRDMGRFVDALEQLRRRSAACVLIVHHEPRNGENLRGSTALEGAATTILRVSKDGVVVELTNPKQKDAPEQPPMLLALVPVGESAILSQSDVRLTHSVTASEQAILTALETLFETAGASKTELQGAADLSRASWFRAIKSLTDKGLVLEAKRGNGIRYTLPTTQRESLFDE